MQVAGRAGRAERPGEVWIQTHQPDNPHLNTLIRDGYASYAMAELDTRARRWPTTDQAARFGTCRVARSRGRPDLPRRAQRAADAGISALGPAPSPVARVANRHRAQLLLMAEHRAALHQALKRLVATVAKQPVPRHLRWSLDIDPYDML